MVRCFIINTKSFSILQITQISLFCAITSFFVINYLKQQNKAQRLSLEDQQRLTNIIL